METKTAACLVAILLGLILFGCGQSQPAQPPDEVTLQLKWSHQAQFAGYYLAQEKGYYARENIKVKFMEGGVGTDLIHRLTSGQADFAVLTPEYICIARSRGLSIKAIAAIYRRSATVYVAKAESGIIRPSDFIGKTVACGDPSGSQKDFEIQFMAMMNKLDLDVSKVKIVPYDPTYTDFYSGLVDITPTYSTGGLIKLRRNGLRLNLVWPGDYGIHFYSDTLVTTDKLIAEKPDLVNRFLRASLQGWRGAVQDYPEAVAITMKYAKNADRELQTAMMEAMLPLVHTGEGRIGWMKPSVWQNMVLLLEQQNLLPVPIDPESAYTMRFLEEYYGDKAP